MIEFTDITENDITEVIGSVRVSDEQEVSAASGKHISEILRNANKTTESYCAKVDGVATALFGINVSKWEPLIWMVATDNIRNVNPRTVFRLARAFIRTSVKKYGTLTNYVCLDNDEAFRFLDMLGAKFSRNPVEMNGLFFVKFYFYEGY